MLKILLLAAVAIGIAGPAHAGPVAAVVAWVGSTLAAGGVGAALLRIAIGIGANLLSTAIGKAAMDKPKVNVQFDVDFGDDTPLTFIAGDYATAGKLKYIGSWGKNTRWITEVIEISALPITGLQNVWFNDEIGDIRWSSPRTENGQVMGYPVKNFSEGVGTGDERDRCWIKLVDGTQTAADPFLVATFGSDADYPWTSAMVGRGKAYAILTYYYDPEVMTSAPSKLFQPQPLPMYDPRKDSTAGGSGAHRWGNRATYEATRNPAVIAYNIVRGIYFGTEWIFGGRNLPAWRLPLAEWFAAMNACDATIALAGGGTEPAFRCGLQISADMTPADVLEEIGRAANMRFAEVGGMLKPIVGLPGAAAFAFTDDSILITEGQSYKPFNGLGETFNALSATYPEPAEKWSTKDAPEFVHAAATADDGGRYLPTSTSYPAAPYRRQVQRLMRAQMRDYRRMRLHQFYLPPEAYALEPLVDMVSWTSERNGYVNKLFTVESVDKTPGMNVLVTLREVDPSDYDWSSDFEMPTEIVPPVVVRPWTQAITGFAVIGETITDTASKARAPALRVSCAGDEVGVTHIQIQVRKNGTADPYLDVQRPFNELFVWRILNVVQQTTYQVRARLISNLTPKSIWTGWLNATTPAIYLDGGDFVDGVTGLFEDAGLKATRIIANLSVPGTAVGELAWNRADSRLYRWNGAAWVHFIQESVTGLLDETSFAASIRVPKIVSSLPTSGNRNGDLAVLSSNRRLYRWVGTEWVDQAAADQIVGQLIAAQISAGAVGADQLAANAVAARHMLIADFTNLVPNADISDAGSWTIAPAWTRALSGTAFAGMYWTYIDAGAAGSVFSLPFSVDAGAEYLCSVEARANAASDNVVLVALIQWQQTDGTVLGTSTIRGAGAVPNTRQTYSVSAIAPAGATRARLQWFLGGASTVGRLYVGSPSVRRKNGGELIVDGTLRAQHIEVETLTGGLMAPAGIITKAAQIDDLVVRRAHLQDASVNALKIAGNALYIPYLFTAADRTIGTGDTSANQMLVFDRTIPDFEGGGYLVAFNAYFDGTGGSDSFGMARLVIDGAEVARTKFGVRTSGANSQGMFPVTLLGSASGTGTTRIRVYAWNASYNSDTSPNNPYVLRNIKLTVSGTRR